MRAWALLLFIGACSTDPAPAKQPVPNIDYILEAIPDDASRVFIISLNAIADRDLCYLQQDWPFPNGDWLGEEAPFAVISDSRTIIPPRENFGSCVGPKCTIRQKALTVRTARLNYSVFGDGAALSNLNNKQLKYELAVRFC